MLILDPDQFEKLKSDKELFYKTIGEVYCPYLGEKVSFNAKGLEHLKFKKKNHARSSEDQYVRFKLLHLAPEAVRLSKTIQGISHTKTFELVRSNARTEMIMKPVSYYEFIAILEDKRVRVVIKQVEAGPKYFWSIIPFWKVDKNSGKRKMSSGNLEEN